MKTPKQILTIIVRYVSAWAWRHEIGLSEGLFKLKRICADADENKMELEIDQDPDVAKWIATCFASLVANAPNYTEMQFTTVAKYHGKWDWLTVTIQKLNGKTPHQLRMELLERLKFMVNTPVITPEEMEQTRQLIAKHTIVSHNK